MKKENEENGRNGMEFLIFSDSHGKRKAVAEAISRQIRTPDAIFYLGDGLADIGDRYEGIPVIRVRGNCDWRFPEEPVKDLELLSFEGHRLLLTHGHLYGAKSGFGGLLTAAKEFGADLVLFGHTHRQELLTFPGENGERPVYLFNPGSIAAGDFGTLRLEKNLVLFAHGNL